MQGYGERGLCDKFKEESRTVDATMELLERHDMGASGKSYDISTSTVRDSKGTVGRRVLVCRI